MKTFYKYVLVFLLLFCSTYAFPVSQQLWVGQTYRCEATSSIVGGFTSDISWSTSGGYFSLNGSYFYRDVTVHQYFLGTGSVTVTWKERLTSNSPWENRSQTWYFTCIENPVSIFPTNLMLKVGETSSVGYSHAYDNSYTSAANVYFVSNNSSVATVSSSGTVKAIRPGSAYINVHSKVSDASKAPYCLVTVTGDDNNSSEDNNSSFDNEGPQRHIYLKESGTLSTYIPSSEQNTITHLTITGCLNGTDLKLIRKMARCSKDDQGKLQYLDLREARFVSGGSWYCEYWGEKQYTDNSYDLPAYSLNSSDLRTLYLPKFSEKIRTGAIGYCNKLVNLHIPLGITTIENINFTCCDILSEITFPSTITNIKSEIGIICDTYNCQKLKKVVCYAMTPPECKITRMDSNAKLYVPKGTSNLYWRSGDWADFSDIIEMNSNAHYPFSIACWNDGGSILCKDSLIRRQHNDIPNSYEKHTFELLKNDTITLQIIPDNGYSISTFKINKVDKYYLLKNNCISLTNFDELKVIEVSFKPATSLENISSSEKIDVQKILRNNQLFIIRDGKTYNIMGQEM